MENIEGQRRKRKIKEKGKEKKKERKRRDKGNIKNDKKLERKKRKIPVLVVLLTNRRHWRPTTSGTRRLLPAVYVENRRHWKPTTGGYPHEPPTVGCFLYRTNRSSEKPKSRRFTISHRQAAKIF